MSPQTEVIKAELHLWPPDRVLIKQCEEVRQDFRVIHISGYLDDVNIHRGVLEKKINYTQNLFTMDGLAKKVEEVLNENLKHSVYKKFVVAYSMMVTFKS